jgi:hypothetical protein
MNIASPRRWRVAEHADLTSRYWDGEFVFHHALANDTHRLSDAAGRVLLQLAQAGEQDLESLALACELPVADAELILSELAKLDLVAWR